ncbi:hypothetical protein JTB14_003044 [Gonioctena quinquepunctata]|nr:hypothetical protein JTB14_003044 [Gonioctena quinquepunctata]
MSVPVRLLLPEDVPGALLKNNLLIEDHSVAELQRWLQCRGYKKCGSKTQLIERVKNCIKNGQDQKICPGIDNGKWYDMKRNLKQDTPICSKHYNLQLKFDRVKWGRFPSCRIPEYYNKGHIYTYIIGENVQNEDPDVEIDDEQNIVTSVKPFRRGSQYVDSDHVSEVFDSSDGSYYIAKCKCQSSFRKKVLYNVEIVLNRISGAVVRGSCECKQSSLGKCSHVTAFLIFICRYVEKYGTVVMAPTCRPREWGIGSRNRDPGQTSKSTYPMKRLKPLKRAEFDPRPKNYTREVDLNSFIVDLQKGEPISMFETIFKLQYDDFQYSSEELDIFITTNILIT